MVKTYSNGSLEEGTLVFCYSWPIQGRPYTRAFKGRRFRDECLVRSKVLAGRDSTRDHGFKGRERLSDKDIASRDSRGFRRSKSLVSTR